MVTRLACSACRGPSRCPCCHRRSIGSSPLLSADTTFVGVTNSGFEQQAEVADRLRRLTELLGLERQELARLEATALLKLKHWTGLIYKPL